MGAEQSRAERWAGLCSVSLLPVWFPPPWLSREWDTFPVWQCPCHGSTPSCSVSLPSAPHATLQVDAILGEQPELKEKLFTVLKQYAAQRRVECLAHGLSLLLTQESHQPLIDSIRYQGHLHAALGPPNHGFLCLLLPGSRAGQGGLGGSCREGWENPAGKGLGWSCREEIGRILQGRGWEGPAGKMPTSFPRDS